MTQVDPSLSTGLPGLDRVLRGLIPGDNIVLQVASIDSYVPFVEAFWKFAARSGKSLIYFRFASHGELVPPEAGAAVHRLRPEVSFESFIGEVHRTIEQTGRGGYYVFDCLSELAADWYSDQMLGNFFMLTCPYLYDMGAIAYFALLRSHHSASAIAPITEIAQVVMDVRRYQDRLYIHPLKVQQRHSPTMYMLHVWRDREFSPVRQSASISEVLTSAPGLGPEPGAMPLDVWQRTFLSAEQVQEAYQSGQCAHEKVQECFEHLLRMMISRDERLLSLARKYMTLPELLSVSKRMIGTGLIGGKSVGMLLARAILNRTDKRWEEVLERHDSFYIGSDVFYTFLVRNGIWWLRQRHQDPSRLRLQTRGTAFGGLILEGPEPVRQRMLTGSFGEATIRQFESMLDYFGQSPIIVRSSSLLEDNFGNSFAGKYESVFCANQAPRENRLEDFLTAVRTIYASMVSERALRYRAQRGLLERDEQMALLVQRVSGALYGSLFYPQMAGVGLSFNPYVWNKDIDPKAGMVRLVFGLGTRAVDRSDDDYTRVIALNAPELRPESGIDAVRQYSQKRVDVLDLEANQLVSRRFQDVARRSEDLPLELFATRDDRAAATDGQGIGEPVLTFKELFRKTDFVATIREMLRVLHQAYDYPVDVEFTANFSDGHRYKINLLQCRPLQVRGAGAIQAAPVEMDPRNVVLKAHGAVIGQSRCCQVDRLIYVVPAVYGRMPVADRYSVARLIGRITRVQEPQKAGTTMLLGPGRWGTTTPSLGVPVSFADINPVSVLCEIVAMRDDLVPDVSLGTHFLNELVEMDILYLALFPGRENNRLNNEFLDKAPNRLTVLLSDADKWAPAVRVIDAADLNGGSFILHADMLRQDVVCYIERQLAGTPASSGQGPARS